MLKKVETYDWEDHAGVVLISWTQLLKTYPRVCCWRRALGVGFWLEKKPVIMTWNLSLLQPSHTILIQYHSIMRFTSLFDIYIYSIYIYVYSIYIYIFHIYIPYIYTNIYIPYIKHNLRTRAHAHQTPRKLAGPCNIWTYKPPSRLVSTFSWSPNVNNLLQVVENQTVQRRFNPFHSFIWWQDGLSSANQ